MAWNQSGNNSDPWGNQGNKKNPFDLDKSLKGVLDRFNLSNGKGGSNLFLSLFIFFVALVFWISSGFYTIKEAERGVLLRFGAYYDIVEPGLHWKPNFIDDVFPVDVKGTRTQTTKGNMLTQDENVVVVEMEIQYRIGDPYKYLFSTTDADKSLKEATDSALRYVVGHNVMDDILTTGRKIVRDSTLKELLRIIDPYDIGLDIVDVNMLPARPPENVQQAYDDAISAQEDEERYIKSAIVYQKGQEPKAIGKAKRIEEEALAYKEEVISKAIGETSRFNQLLPKFLEYPDITKQRLYLDAMTSILQNSTKVLVDSSNNSMLYLPLDKIVDSTRTAKKEMEAAQEKTDYQNTLDKINNDQGSDGDNFNQQINTYRTLRR